MNKTFWFARILATRGVLETGVGLVLVVDPSALSSLLLRTPLEGAGLGSACWCARETSLMPAGLPALSASILHGVLAAALLSALFGRRRSSAGP